MVLLFPTMTETHRAFFARINVPKQEKVIVMRSKKYRLGMKYMHKSV